MYGYGSGRYEYSSEAASATLRWWKRDKGESRKERKAREKHEQEQRILRRSFFDSLKGTKYYGTVFSSLGR